MVTAASGSSVGSFSSGETIPASEGVGRYELSVQSGQPTGGTWDVAVPGQTIAGGRLSSKNWRFNAGSFAKSAGTDASFFALVPSGNDDSSMIIELKLDGLAGYVYDINANRVGVDGVSGGKSVLESGNATTPEYYIFLNPPSVASYTSVTPSVSGFHFEGGESTDVAGNPITACTMILPGASRGYFYFDTNVAGTFHLQCDLDGDGDFSTTSGADLLITGASSQGTNVVGWSGQLNGEAISAGDYNCRCG